jgi:hypothetical protein
LRSASVAQEYEGTPEENMIKRLLLLLMASGALAANASTISFQPAAQTITLGSSTTVDVSLGGLSANQALGAFDLFVLNNASILTPTNVFFYSNLGDPGFQLTDSILASGSANAAETSLESTSTLLALQSSQPFSLFRLTYLAIGVGTSSLTLGPNLVLADGDGTILTTPDSTPGSITVVDSGVSPVPEPSTLALLGSGVSILMASIKRRRSGLGESASFS